MQRMSSRVLGVISLAALSTSCGPTLPVASAADYAACCDCLGDTQLFGNEERCVDDVDACSADLEDGGLDVLFDECGQACLASCDVALRAGSTIRGAATGALGTLYIRLADDSEGGFRTGSWSDMLAVCEGEGGTLASFDSEDANFAAKDAGLGGWIGLNDRESENLWQWSDGSTWNPLLVDDWAGGEPNDNGGEDCVELTSDGWNDLNCDNTLPAICAL